jgi:hypothetical protein
LSHASSSFCSGYFESRVSFCPGQPLSHFMLPTAAGAGHYVQLLVKKKGSWKFLPGLALNHDSPNLSLSSS